MSARQSEQSLTITNGGTSQLLALSTTSAVTNAWDATEIVVYVDVAVYARTAPNGATPVALGTGVDQYLVAGNMYRFPWIPGNKLALICLAGTGNAYITPGV